MKTHTLFLLCTLYSILYIPLATAAITPASSQPPQFTIKKASSVQEKQQDKMDAVTGTNLAGMAIGLFAGIQALKNEEKAMSQSCAPSIADRDYVNKMMREYAKTGQKTSKEMLAALGAQASDGWCSYKEYVRTGQGEKCFDLMVGSDDDGRIWYGYPSATEGFQECPPDKPNCKDKKYYSNVYEIYAVMNWTDADLLPDELSTHSKLMAKAEECAPEVIARKNRERAGNLITGTLGSIGQKQNTAGTMEAVGGLMQGMGTNGLGGLGTVGLQMLPGLLNQ